MPDAEILRAAANERGGFLTWSDAEAAGCSSYDVRQAVSGKQWERLHPGVFVDREWYESLDPRPRHLVQVRARLHVLDSGWSAARRSAAIVHGLPLLGKLPNQPVLVRDRPTGRTRGSSRFERFNSVPDTEVEVVDEVRTTTLARTVVDIAREESLASGLVVADAALARGLSLDEALHVAHRCRAWPRAPRVRPVLLAADGRSESVLESLSRAGFIRAGLPEPELQVEVWHGGRFVARTDFLWRGVNVIGESDGRSKYESVSDLYEEKRREENLRDLGFEIVRWDWGSAMHPDRGLLAALSRAFARGALNTLAPGVELRAASHPFAA